MKKLLVLLSLMLFISVHGTGLGDFNIFTQRRIIVDPLQNIGPEDEDYLVEILTEQLLLLLRSAPFISLTDRERSFLLTLSLEEEYAGRFAQTNGSIGYRLTPRVTAGPSETADYPLHLSGTYRLVSEGEFADTKVLEVQITVFNAMTEESSEPVLLSGALADFIDDAQTFLYPFLTQFLRYTIYRMNLSTEPSDALIWVDDRFVGVGNASNVIVTPGSHRISISRDGYREYRDLVQVSRDGFTRHIILQPETALTQYHITTTPEDVRVFLDVNYAGTTPLKITVGPNNRTLTLRREGYRTETVVVQDLPTEGGGVHFNLLERALAKDLNERAERQLKWAKGLSYVGLGLLVSSIFFGIQETSKQQEADLYGSTDPVRATEAQEASDVYNALLISSLVLAGGFFTFSFVKTVQYFNTYNYMSDFGVPILSTEVAF